MLITLQFTLQRHLASWPEASQIAHWNAGVTHSALEPVLLT